MNNITTLLIVVLSLIFFTNCKNDQKQPQSSATEKVSEIEKPPEKRKLDYEVVNTDLTETKYKAQITKYVVYNDSIFNKDALSDVLLEVYFSNRKAKDFKNFDEPTVVAVYIFTSEEQAKTEKDAWIAMLVKGPDDESPKLSYNDLKLKSLAGLNDKVKSKDEIALDNLNEYLEKRNVTLCDLYKQFGSYELNNIHKADAKYPNFGKEHTAYVKELDKADKKRIMTKYKLADSIFTQTIVYGMGYCK